MKIQGYEMRAVGEPLALSTREVEDPGPGQAIVEVTGCGVCHTDLGFLFVGVPVRHELPLVLGHEVAGKVVAEGPSERSLLGRNVIVPAVMPCGECALCQVGRGDICKAQLFPGCDDHGGFASHVVVPSRFLCEIPEGAVDEQGVANLSVVADAVSTAYEAVTKSGLSSGDFAIFVGAGGVGGFGVQIAHALGARVLAIDVDDDRLSMMAEHGAEWTLNAKEFEPKNLKKRIRTIAREEKLPGVMWKIFETSGTGPGQETALNLMVHGAYVGVVGFYAGAIKAKLSNVMAFAARVEGTWGCAPSKYPELLKLVLDGKVQVEPFVESFPMSQINDVFNKLKAHELQKRPVLIPDFDN